MLFPVFNKLYFILWPLGSIFLHINSNSVFPTTRTICSWILALHKYLSPRVTGSWESTQPPSLSFKHQIMVSRAALLGYQQICGCSGLNCTCQQENYWWSRDSQSPCTIPVLTVPFNGWMTGGKQHLGTSSNYCRLTPGYQRENCPSCPMQFMYKHPECQAAI